MCHNTVSQCSGDQIVYDLLLSDENTEGEMKCTRSSFITMFTKVVNQLTVRGHFLKDLYTIEILSAIWTLYGRRENAGLRMFAIGSTWSATVKRVYKILRQEKPPSSLKGYFNLNTVPP